MDLGPDEIRPRNEERNLVQERCVVDLDVRDFVESSVLEDVVRPEERAVGKSGDENQDTGDYHPGETQGVAKFSDVCGCPASSSEETTGRSGVLE